MKHSRRPVWPLRPPLSRAPTWLPKHRQHLSSSFIEENCFAYMTDGWIMRWMWMWRGCKLHIEHGPLNAGDRGQLCNTETIIHTSCCRRASLLNNHAIQAHHKFRGWVLFVYNAWGHCSCTVIQTFQRIAAFWPFTLQVNAHIEESMAACHDIPSVYTWTFGKSRRESH